ncbi:MAG TPA: hypothetical protein VEY09_02375 [Pyrinomonadaceae bacterium]|nr:hypothetical protein [Pyrinomonadaceae bacterium]
MSRALAMLLVLAAACAAVMNFTHGREPAASAQEGAPETPQVKLARTSVRGITLVGVRRIAPGRDILVATLRNDTGRTIYNYTYKRGEKIKGEERWQSGEYASHSFDGNLIGEAGWPPGTESDLMLEPDGKPLRIVAITFDDNTVTGDEFWAEATRGANRRIQRKYTELAEQLEGLPESEVEGFLQAKSASDDSFAAYLALDALRFPGVTLRETIARLRAKGEGRAVRPLRSSRGGLKIGQ